MKDLTTKAWMRTAGGAARMLAVVALLLGGVAPVAGQSADAGRVDIPLEEYRRLLEASRPGDDPRPAPAAWSFGTATATVTVEDGARPTARVVVDTTLEVLEDEWVLVPVLPAGTAVEEVRVDGREVRLVAGPDGLSWATKTPARHSLRVVVRADAQVSDGGTALALGLPRATSTTLRASIPGSGLDVTVIPASGVRSTARDGSTEVVATVPGTPALQIAWRSPDHPRWSAGRAAYTAELVGDALRWSGEIRIDLFTDGPTALPLLPRTSTLTGLRVDGEEVPLLVDERGFSAWIRGRGTHVVELDFVSQVLRDDGPPRVLASIPPVPVSALELRLPGRKDVRVQPAAEVRQETEGDSTVARAAVPMTDRVEIAWSEAVPEAIRAEARRNAAIVHLVHAEEGVLVVRALAELEITRGTTSRLRLQVPEGVQVNRVADDLGVVADWSIGEDRVLQVFLDREVDGRLLLEVELDRALPREVVRDGSGEVGAVPLLAALDAHRQRGMVALLSGREMGLVPTSEDGATRVGENQLPAWARQTVERTVAHAFKYVEPPELGLAAAAPTREDVRFDARIDSLISLAEVTLRGATQVEIDVKSGHLLSLGLLLPPDTGLLSLTGPSIRDHVLGDPDDEGRVPVRVDFTQEMEGRFPIELVVERLLVEGKSAVDVPLIQVPGAEVAQGRVAVEALAAVEVQPGETAHLTPLDPRELPRQLVLRTTNPILHAWKYVRSESPARLGLEVTRHRLIEVEEAAIDRADLETLVTSDGLAVTTARFRVRNSRRQFLEVELPEGARVWSALVDGNPEKPAVEEGEDGRTTVLLRLIHSTDGFPVELIYETRVAEIRGLGSLDLALPRPDILVTTTRWNLWLPDGVRYREPASDLEVVAAAQTVGAGELESAAPDLVAREVVEPLRLRVPTTGVKISLEKLYANQRDAPASRVRIAFVEGTGARWGLVLVGAAAVVFWLGLVRLVAGRGPRWLAVGLVVVGLVTVGVLVGRWGMSAWPAVAVTVLVGAAAGAARLRDRMWSFAIEP